MPSSTIRIGRVRISDTSPSEAVRMIAGASDTDGNLVVFYANAHTVRLAHHSSSFASDLAAADMVICDGYGPWLASRVLRRPLKNRMTPPDWIEHAIQHVAERRGLVFLLGDEEPVARSAAAYLKERYPDLRVESHHGFFDLFGEEGRRVAVSIADYEPDLLLVGLGQPQQERWIVQHHSTLRVPAVVAVGALFKWWSGEDTRAPSWMAARGLEWAYRFARHPFKHWMRYAVGLPIFALIVLRDLLAHGLFDDADEAAS